jgi:mediator of RNA polymerase II transcription subunit 12
MQMADWTSHFLRVATDDIACFVLTFLIGANALSFATLSRIADSLQADDDPQPRHLRCKLAITMLTVYLLPPRPSSAETLDQQYRFQLAQADFSRHSFESVLKQLVAAINTVVDAGNTPDMRTLRDVLQSTEVRDYVLHCTVEHKKPLQEQVTSILSYNNPTGVAIANRIVEDLLDQKQGQLDSSVSNQEKIPRLVRTVGELSLPLCPLEMQFLLHTSSNSKGAEGGGIEMATSLFEAIMRSPDSERPPWLDLVDGLDSVLLQRLRTIAEVQIVKIVNECCAHMRSESTANVDQMQMLKARALLRRLLYVVDCTVLSIQPQSPMITGTTVPPPHSTPSDGMPELQQQQAVDRFNGIRETLSRHFLPDADAGVKPLTRLSADLTCILLNGLLHLLLVRKLASSSSSSGSHSDVASLLPIMLQVFASPALVTSRSTIEFLYDTTAYISDELTDEARVALAKSEGSKCPSDTRISFILGTQSGTLDAWLGLVTSNQTVLSSVGSITTPASASPTGSQLLSHANTQQSPAAARFGVQRPPSFTPSPQPQRPGPGQAPQLQRQASGALGSIGGPSGGPGAGSFMAAMQQKSFNAPVPFHLRRWEMLPDPGTAGMMANDTAISLGLVGARRVI